MKVVTDKFHVFKYAGDALEELRQSRALDIAECGVASAPTPHNAEDCLRRKQPATHTFEGRTFGAGHTLIPVFS